MDSLSTLDRADVVETPEHIVSKPTEWRFHDEHESRLIAEVRRIRPVLARNAAACEAQRGLTDETVAALNEIDGIWSMVVPTRWGGLGMSGTALARVGAELTKGDPAAAWVVQILNGTTWVATLTSDDIQQDLFGKGLSKVCSAFNPPGTAIPVEGGYMVSGRWPYSSGYQQADWGQWGVVIKNEDGTSLPGNFCFIPTSETTLDLTWETTGLQGTGSHTAVATDVFVPAHRMVLATKSFGTVDAGKRHTGAPSDLFPVIPFVHRSGAGQVVGMAEAILETIIEGAKKRGIVATSYSKAADSSVVQRDIASASIRIQTARMLVEKATAEIDAAALSRTPMPLVDRARNKAQVGYAIQIMSSAVDELMFIGGSGSFATANPVSRFWRDFSMAARHIANIPNVAFEVYGRAVLGIEPNIIMPHLI
ncbi:MAG: acyl-CoA dehydrogenase family protein [Janthinobacterium lividum]